MIGWDGSGSNNEPINYELALITAKDILQQYDVVIITEWLNNVTQSNVLTHILSLGQQQQQQTTNSAANKNSKKQNPSEVILLEGNKKARQRLSPKLMAEKVNMV